MIIFLLSAIFSQSTWIGGPGQAIWSDTTRFYEQKNIKYDIPGMITISQKESYYQEADSLQTTNSTSFIDAITLSFTPSDTMDFVIIISAQLGTEGNGSTVFAEMRVLLDTEIVMQQRVYRQNSSLVDQRNVGGFILKHLDNSPHQVIVQYRTSSSSYLAGINNIRISAKQVDRFYYAEDESLSTTNSTTYIEKLQLNFNQSVDESCLVLAQAEISSNTNGGFTRSELLLDGNSMSTPENKYIINASQFYPFWVSRGVSIASGNHTLSIQFSTTNSSNTAEIRRARIIALPKKDLENISTQESEGPSISFGTSFSTKLNYNFTPPDSGYYIIIAQSYLRAFQGAEARLLIDGVNNGFERFYRWSTSEWMPFFLMKRIYLTNANHNLQIQYRGIGSGWFIITLIQNARIIIIPANTFHNTGELISSTYDSGIYGETRWERISSHAVIPSGTEVKFQIAANNDGTTWNFVGPDGTNNSYYDTTTSPIPSSIYRNRYFRYKVFFTRDTINLTHTLPELTDIKCLYFKDYYVDEPEGNDANYGRMIDPFLTIGKAVSMMKGSDGCIVRTGSYPESIYISPDLSGSVDFPTFFTADTNAAPEVISYTSEFAFYDSAANYIKIKGFNIRGASIVNLYADDCNHIDFYKNNIYIPDGSYGILLENVDTATVKANRTIPDTGASSPYEGIWLWNSRNVDVDSNVIYGMSDNGTSAWFSQDISYTRNLIHNIYVAGILFNQSGACNVYNNTIDTCESGIYATRLSGVITTLNNSITNCKYGFYWLDGTGFVSSDYNNLWNNTSNYISSSGQAVSQGPNDISQNPLYNPDWTLSSGSPNIDAGIDVGLPYVGAAPDIGAYEYGAKKGKSKYNGSFIKNNKDKGTKLIRITNDISGSFLNFSQGKNLCKIGNNLFITFADDTTGNYEIYLAKMDTNGAYSTTKISSSNNIAYFPSISHTGDTIYIFWADKRSGNYQIYSRRSQDTGISWGDEKLVSSAGSSPSISINGDTIHLIFERSIGDSIGIIYTRSTDGGNTWAPEVGISDTSYCSYPEVISDGNNVYAVWEMNGIIYFSSSADGGDIWNTPISLSQSQKYAVSPNINVFNNEIWVVWEYKNTLSWRIAGRKLEDNGNTWSSEVLITKDNEYYLTPDISFYNNKIIIAMTKYETPWNTDMYITSSEDGINWTEPAPVFPEQGLSHYPHLLAGDNYYLTFWDTRDGNPEIYFAKLDKEWQPVIKQKIIPQIFKINLILLKDKIKLSLNLQKDSHLNVNIFDILGRKRLSFPEKHLSPGVHNLYFSIRNLSSGIYFVRIGVRHKKSKTLLTKKIFYIH